MRSLNQDLTFEAARNEFEIRNIDFGSQQMRTLKLLDPDGLYSNLGLLLSDQCTQTVKAAVFYVTELQNFKEHKEITWLLHRQVNTEKDFIYFLKQTHAPIKKIMTI